MQQLQLVTPPSTAPRRPRRFARTGCNPPADVTTHYSPPRLMRCACQDCGAHTMATVGYKVAGSCPNCGSYDLSPVD